MMVSNGWFNGFPARHGGSPKCLVFVMETPIEMDDEQGYPYDSGNLHLDCTFLGPCTVSNSMWTSLTSFLSKYQLVFQFKVSQAWTTFVDNRRHHVVGYILQINRMVVVYFPILLLKSQAFITFKYIECMLAYFRHESCPCWVVRWVIQPDFKGIAIIRIGMHYPFTNQYLMWDWNMFFDWSHCCER